MLEPRPSPHLQQNKGKQSAVEASHKRQWAKGDEAPPKGREGGLLAGTHRRVLQVQHERYMCFN